MKERLLESDAFEEFCQTFTEEMNRLRREHRTKLTAAPREIVSINRRSKEILELLLQGFRDEAWKDELLALERRRTELQAALANVEAEPPLPALHPRMAEVFRQKTMQLAKALEHPNEEQRESARQTIRGLIDRILIPPGDGPMQVVGNLGEMLAAAGGPDGLAAVAYVGCGGSQPPLSAVVATGSVTRFAKRRSASRLLHFRANPTSQYVPRSTDGLLSI